MTNLRELDEKIARALGWKFQGCRDNHKSCAGFINPAHPNNVAIDIPKYSERWSDMGSLITEMGERGWRVCLDCPCPWAKDEKQWNAGFLRESGPFNLGQGHTAPEAVARAALKALTSERGEG